MPRKLPEGEGKRYALSLRTTLELQTRLKERAMKSGRSLAAEVEYRLEVSLAEDDKREADARNNLISKAILGDDDTAELIRTMAAAIGASMTYTGGHWRDDIYARAGVIAAMTAARSAYFSARPYKDDAREADRDRLYKADSTGKLLGRMLAARQLDPAVASWMEDMAAKAPPLPDDMPLMDAQALEDAASAELERKI